jgi:hypothetical protein
MALDNTFGNRRGEGPADPTKCVARVSDHDFRWPHYYQCGNKPVRDGWCNMHHPDKVKTRRDKIDSKAAAERAYSDWLCATKQKREQIAKAVIDGCSWDAQQSLVKEYKALEAAKPVSVSLPR